MDIVIIGSGNMASVLGRKAFDAGHVILQVAGRNRLEVEALAKTLQASAGDLDHIDMRAILYILCISDKALPTVHQWFQHPKAIVVHTAGSVSMDVLAPVAKSYGVLWPLQSIRKEADPIPPFPLIIDANTPECLTILQDFGSTISSDLQQMNDETRSKMHLAAVAAGNFSNHLFALVKDYCDAEQLNMNLLLPLLRETVDRISYAHPREMQTGPAIRGDQATMDKHLEMLGKYTELKQFYQLFSNLIRS
ncbi:MAG: DUF2520 domain-containing protein [Sphingobacteriales bacterium]|nr:MAG: DUF2520 domain-containing protein [Sphingobacteriales bacterium]